jgi:hypothetical protein
MKNILRKLRGDERGAAVLVAVIVISAVILIIAVAMGITSIMENQISLYQSQSNKTFVQADACGEEALTQISRDHSYTGETLVVDDTSCVIVVSGMGANRTITVAATNDNYAKNITINVKIVPTISVTSWQETAT